MALPQRRRASRGSAGRPAFGRLEGGATLVRMRDVRRQHDPPLRTVDLERRAHRGLVGSAELLLGQGPVHTVELAVRAELAVETRHRRHLHHVDLCTNLKYSNLILQFFSSCRSKGTQLRGGSGGRLQDRQLADAT